MEKITLAAVKATQQQTGMPYAIVDDSAIEEGIVQFAFTGEFEGREVVFDTFFMTLETDFFSGVLEDAIFETIELNPEFKDADFDAEEGKHIDIMEGIAEDLVKSEDYQVAENIEVEETEKDYVEIDVSINVEEITPEVIKKFVEDFKSGNLELDDTYYSFEME